MITSRCHSTQLLSRSSCLVQSDTAVLTCRSIAAFVVMLAIYIAVCSSPRFVPLSWCTAPCPAWQNSKSSRCGPGSQVLERIKDPLMTLVSRDHHETAYAVLAHFLIIAQRAPLIFASVRLVHALRR